jgi:hypothetical protein
MMAEEVQAEMFSEDYKLPIRYQDAGENKPLSIPAMMLKSTICDQEDGVQHNIIAHISVPISTVWVALTFQTASILDFPSRYLCFLLGGCLALRLSLSIPELTFSFAHLLGMLTSAV